MKIPFLFTLFSFILILPIKCNTVEGIVKVVSCNCTDCCYPNDSYITISMDYNFLLRNFDFINLTGQPNGIDCANKINTLEICNQISGEIDIDNYKYKKLLCNTSNSSLGAIMLSANSNEQTYLKFSIVQNNKQCELIVSYCKNMVLGLIKIVLFIFLLCL